MHITTERFGNVLVAHTPDDLSDETAPELLNALSDAVRTGQVNIVLQMDRSETYDSQGLTALLDLQDLARGRGGGVKVCALTDTGRKIFEVTRLDRRFDLYDSVIDAVSSFQT